MYLRFFTTNILLLMLPSNSKFPHSVGFKRKNEQEWTKNLISNNNTHEWRTKKPASLWWTDSCVVNGWDDMHAVHHCVINKIQINVKSPDSSKLTTASSDYNKCRNELRGNVHILYYIRQGFGSFCSTCAAFMTNIKWQERREKKM